MKSLSCDSLVILLLSLFCITTAVSQTAKPVKDDAGPVAGELDAFFHSQIDSFGLVGVSGCIVKDGRVAWSGGYGLAEIEKSIPVTPDMLFNLGSVSKTVTVAALMHLWEEKKFTFDDDIDQYLPFKVRNPRYPDKPITFRMLLTHTSTISDMHPGEGTLPFLQEDQDSRMPLEDVLRGFLIPGGKYYADTNYNAAVPGGRYEYSNLSFSLIGYLIERISGEPFTVYCKKALFTPLEMNESTWRLTELKLDHHAFRYVRDSQTGENHRKVPPSTWPGYMDGGLYASVTEYGNFLAMLANSGSFKGREVLRPATLDTMLSLQHVAGAPPGRGLPTIGHAFLWILSRAGDREIYQMNGFGPAFFTEVYFNPKTRTGGAFFTTGQFRSFPAMGQFIMSTLNRLIGATDRL